MHTTKSEQLQAHERRPQFLPEAACSHRFISAEGRDSVVHLTGNSWDGRFPSISGEWKSATENYHSRTTFRHGRIVTDDGHSLDVPALRKVVKDASGS